MTYSIFDLSIFGGKPVELYRFACGSDVWTYSAGPAAEHNSETYAATPVSRSDIEDSGEMSRQSITVSLPRDSEVAQLYTGGNGEAMATLTIFRRHSGDTETVTYWKGRVTVVAFDGATCVLTCESLFTLQRRNRRGRYTRMCSRVHYWPGCGLDKSEWAESATVTAIDGRTVTVSLVTTRDDSWFSAGMIEYAGVLRMIYSHAGNDLVLMSEPKGLAVDDAVTLYPGCDRTRATCRDKFDNLLNSNACAWIPNDNPFQGSIV